MAKGQKNISTLNIFKSETENNVDNKNDMMKTKTTEEENIYANDNMDELKIIEHNKSDEGGGSEEEEYYILPNKVETPSQRKESSVSINMTDLPQDPEIKFAKAIIDGDEEIVRQILESSLNPMENNNNVVMKNFNVSKIDSCTSDNFQEDLSFSHISPLDLAALHNQVSILDLILDYSLEHVPKFENYIKIQDFIHKGMIFQRLVLKCPKISEEWLNCQITSNNHTSSETKKSNEPTEVFFNFDIFQKRSKGPPKQEPKCPKKAIDNHSAIIEEEESFAISQMMQQGQRDLLKHPLTEAFVYLKWEKLNCAFYLSFVYQVFLALLVTLTAFIEVQPPTSTVSSKKQSYISNLWEPKTNISGWVLIACYIPCLLKLIFLGLYRRSDFWLSTWVRIKRPCPPFPIPTLDAVLHVGLLASISAFVALLFIGGLQENYQQSLTHSAAWSVLLSWSLVLLQIADCPCLGVYIYILQVVLLDIVAFFISVLALILGFAFAFHLILQKSSSTKEGDQNLFQNPITSLIAVLTMAVGHFGVSDEVMASSLVPGTTEAMFVIFYFLFSIGMMTILVGLCVANIKDILKQKEDFKLAKMVTNIQSIEEAIFAMAKLFHCCSLSEKIIRISSVLYEGQSSKYKVCPVSKSVLIQKRSTRPRQSVLPLRFGNPSSIADMEVYQVSEEPSQDSVKTHFSLPGWIWENARPIIEERQELERVQAEAERNRASNQNDDYTSLYWDPEAAGGRAGAKSENEYEVVEDNSRYFGGGLLRGIRESILRELRRDLAKLTSRGGGTKDKGHDRHFGGHSRSEAVKSSDGKCVNVRPGLALGIIHLQAGNKHKITLN